MLFLYVKNELVKCVFESKSGRRAANPTGPSRSKLGRTWRRWRGKRLPSVPLRTGTLSSSLVLSSVRSPDRAVSCRPKLNSGFPATHCRLARPKPPTSALITLNWPQIVPSVSSFAHSLMMLEPIPSTHSWLSSLISPNSSSTFIDFGFITYD